MEDELEAVRVSVAELRRAEAQFQSAAARFRAVVWAAYRAGATQDAIAAAGRITRQRVGEIIRTSGNGG